MTPAAGLPSTAGHHSHSVNQSRWRALLGCLHGSQRSKYVIILPGTMSAPQQEEFSQLLSPVELGPSQLRTLWATVGNLFAVPEGWHETKKDAWIQGRRASGPQREKLKSYDLESFLGNLNLKGLLDDVTVCFDQTLERRDGNGSRNRFLQIHIPQRGRPEVSLIGDPAWHSGAIRTVDTFFRNEKASGLQKRVMLVAAGVALGLAAGGVIAIPGGWVVGLLLGIMFALLAGVLMQAGATYFIPSSRIYADENSGKPGVLYDWGAQIITGIVSGLIVYALLWATGHL